MIHKFKNQIRSNEYFFIVLLIAAMAIWGGSWTSGKIVSGVVTPVVLTFLRFFISFIAFIPLLVIFKEKLSIDKKSLLLTMLASVFVVAYNILFFLGLEVGMAGAGGVLVTSINPIFTFLLSLIIFRTAISLKEIIGLVLGLTAGLILVGIWNINNLFVSGNLIFLIASAIWSVITITGAEVQKKNSLFTYSFYLYGMSSLMMLPFAIPSGLMDIFKADHVFWLNVLYLSVISTVFATSVFFFSSKKISANRASSFILLVPVFALGVSFLVLGEIPNLPTIIGGIMAICGTYLINRKKLKRIGLNKSSW